MNAAWVRVFGPLYGAVDPLVYLERASRRGGVVPLDLPLRPWFGLFDPEAVRSVLQAPADEVVEVPPTRFGLPDLRGSGVVTSGGDLHQALREAILAALAPDRLPAYGRVIDSVVSSFVAWMPGQRIDAPAEAAGLTRLLGARLLFGVRIEDPDPRARAVFAALDTIVAVLRSPTRSFLSALVPWDLPGGIRGRALAGAMATLDQATERLPDEEGCLGHALRVAGGLSGASLRDNLVQLYLAGHDTVSSALVWTWYLLAGHPDVASRLRDDVAGQVTARSEVVEDVIKESLRLFPTSPFGVRYAVRDRVIDGVAVPAGAGLIYAPWVTHRHPRWWDAPEDFVPERFRRSIVGGAYLPFGVGANACVGAALARLQLRLVVSRTASFRLQRLPSPEVRVACGWEGSLRHLHPADGLALRVVEAPWRSPGFEV